MVFTNRELGVEVEIRVHSVAEGPVPSHVLGCFLPFKGSGKAAGRIHLREDALEPETIVHEAFHAGIEAARRSGARIWKKRGEERAVTIAAQLATRLLEQFYDMKLVEKGGGSCN